MEVEAETMEVEGVEREREEQEGGEQVQVDFESAARLLNWS